MDKANAERMRDRANAMLAEVAALPEDQRPRGVNWGDLSVQDVRGEVSYLNGGGVQIFVDVEEAAPECGAFFTRYFNEPGIIVRCEW
jgi:hypothetical protein